VLLGAELNAVLEHASDQGKERGGRSAAPAPRRAKGSTASAASVASSAMTNFEVN
jgi:hypothetical protein